ncbi:hypothetical protein SAMN05216285_0865 [Natrinema salifodinae]|uniref:Uncharacterized protein n=1 Tax=Natrinema salifodinae TaxID=1202768 RepID=A0A1I0MF09_9EURY|nr:hypothetical protein SAMN05216285_0865 [Natrinema salifodinae]
MDTELSRLIGQLLWNPSLFNPTVFFTTINSIGIRECFSILVFNTQVNSIRFGV